VPFSNRIANGRLAFAGEEITLAPNARYSPSHARRRLAQAMGRVATTYIRPNGLRHDAGAAAVLLPRPANVSSREERLVLPWHHNLEQRAVPRPGLHPFFRRDGETELTCRTASGLLSTRGASTARRRATRMDFSSHARSTMSCST